MKTQIHLLILSHSIYDPKEFIVCLSWSEPSKTVVPNFLATDQFEMGQYSRKLVSKRLNLSSSFWKIYFSLEDGKIQLLYKVKAVHKHVCTQSCLCTNMFVYSPVKFWKSYVILMFWMEKYIKKSEFREIPT